jgi:hypothetical protein
MSHGTPLYQALALSCATRDVEEDSSGLGSFRDMLTYLGTDAVFSLGTLPIQATHIRGTSKIRTRSLGEGDKRRAAS